MIENFEKIPTSFIIIVYRLFVVPHQGCFNNFVSTRDTRTRLKPTESQRQPTIVMKAT